MKPLIARPLKDDAEPIATKARRPHNGHLKAPIRSEENFGAGRSGDFFDAANQDALNFFAVLSCQDVPVIKQFHQNFLFPFFRDCAGVGIPAPDVFGMGGFRPGKPFFRGIEPFQPVAQAVLAFLVLRMQGFQLPQLAGQLHLHKDERIAGSGGFHFRRIGGLGSHIVNDTLEQIALAELFYGR